MALVELFHVAYYRHLEIWVGGHSGSLKTTLFESLGTVSYSHFTGTMAVYLAISETASKEWPEYGVAQRH